MEPTDRAYDSLRWIMACATGALVLGLMLRTGSLLCPNDISRWDTVWSLVDKGTYIIDGTPWDTIDKVQRDGHFYSSKIPLLPTMAAGEYWLIQQLTGWTITHETDRICRTIMFTVNIVPLVAYVGLLGALIGWCVQDAWWRAYWLVAAAFGTYVTGYSATFNDHSVGAWGCLFALYSAVRILYCQDRRWHHFALCGLFAAWTLVNQLPAVFLSVGLFVWLLAREPKQTLTIGLPAALLPIAGFLITTHVSTGGFVPYYLMRNSSLYNYPGSYWVNPQGNDALNEPKPVYVFNFLLGHHGFLSLSPIFILSVVGLVYTLKDRLTEWRGLAIFAFLVTLAQTTLNTFTTNNYGGGCHGFRYLIWPVPMWILLGAMTADKYGGARWLKVLAIIFLVVSVVSMACAVPNPWTESWLSELFKHLGWQR